MNSLLDLRFVIGLFFVIIGVLLLLDSFLVSAADAQITNRWCGIVFGVFGGFMILLSRQRDETDEVLEDVPKKERGI